MSCSCPALIISAPASGQGKTTVTAALAYHYRQQGLDVRVFKTGPDFLDPKILQYASKNPVYQLDLWMVGESRSRYLLYKTACEADLILIEGVMGLYDGKPSTADLSRLYAIPVLAVIDASGMAATFAAIAHGLFSFDPKLATVGVIANNVGSHNHATMLRESLPEHITWYGALHRNNDIALGDRHLGLLSVDEIKDIDQRLQLAASMLMDNGLDMIPAAVSFAEIATEKPAQLLTGLRIGMARDSAFSFYYQANIDLLIEMGAEIIYFSPINDASLPDVDSLYLPGGYPELHLKDLENNFSMRTAIRRHHKEGKPMLAECGGLLYLLESLSDADGNTGCMTSILPGHAKLHKKLVNLSMQSIPLEQGYIRGHSFHYSTVETKLKAQFHTEPNGKFGQAEAVYSVNKLLASYMHLYMPSNPIATAEIFTP